MRNPAMDLREKRETVTMRAARALVIPDDGPPKTRTRSSRRKPDVHVMNAHDLFNARSRDRYCRGSRRPVP